MSAADLLKQKNGLKTTQSVLQKQQSGEDAAQKQMPVFTQRQLDVVGRKIDAENASVPSDELPSLKEARLRTIANQKGVENGTNMNYGVDKNEEDKEEKSSIPIVKKKIDEEDVINKLRSVYGITPFAPVSNDSELGQGTNASSRPKTYADIFKMLNPEPKVLSDKEKKRMRTKLRIAAVADGLRALSDIYFASKGAPVEHDPEKDLTRNMLKRKQMMDEQYKKNRDAWLKGYQRALEKDNDAQFKQDTLNEQKRYHDIIANNNKEKNDLSQQKLDLSKMKYESDKDYKESLLKLKQAVAAGTIEYHQAMATAAKMRAARSGRSQATKEDFDEAYMDIQGRDKEGLDKASEQVAKSGINPTTTAGRKQTVKTYRKNNSKKPAAKTSAKSKFSIHK